MNWITAQRFCLAVIPKDKVRIFGISYIFDIRYPFGKEKFTVWLSNMQLLLPVTF